MSRHLQWKLDCQSKNQQLAGRIIIFRMYTAYEITSLILKFLIGLSCDLYHSLFHFQLRTAEAG